MPTLNKHVNVSWRTVLSWFDNFNACAPEARQALAKDLALVLNATATWQNRLIVDSVTNVLSKPVHAMAAAPFPGSFSIEALCRFMSAYAHDAGMQNVVPAELVGLGWGKATKASKYLAARATVSKFLTELQLRKRRSDAAEARAAAKAAAAAKAEADAKARAAADAKNAKAGLKAVKAVQQELGLAASSHQPDVVALALAVAQLRVMLEDMGARMVKIEERVGLRLAGGITVTEVKP